MNERQETADALDRPISDELWQAIKTFQRANPDMSLRGAAWLMCGAPLPAENFDRARGLDGHRLDVLPNSGVR